MDAPIRIVIADDHPVVRIGLRQLLHAEPGFAIVGESTDGRDTLRQVRSLKPDILLLDLAMPGLTGFEVLRELSKEAGRTQTILLTAGIEQNELVEALQHGSRGVVIKDSAARDLVEAIHAVSNGQFWVNRQIVGNLIEVLQQRARILEQRQSYGLTPRELQIISTVVVGCTNKDIAQTLSISEDTVKRHLTNIFDKVGVSTRLELGLFAVHHRLVRF